MGTIKYYIYHIPGIKIGVSKDPKNRVKRQGYTNYEILEEHIDIDLVSTREIELQIEYGYGRDNGLLYSKTHNIKRKGFTKEQRIKGLKARIKITAEMADEIREKYSTGNYTTRKLAEEYNISTYPVKKIIKNQYRV